MYIAGSRWGCSAIGRSSPPGVCKIVASSGCTRGGTSSTTAAAAGNAMLLASRVCVSVPFKTEPYGPRSIAKSSKRSDTRPRPGQHKVVPGRMRAS
eukprot:1111067-Amphidinium_carterae.1